MILNKSRIKSKILRLIYGQDENRQWCRIVMDRETEMLVSGLQVSTLKVLEVSGSKWEHFGFNTYRSINYPEIDICNEKLDEKFDLIVVEQVFEHLLKPWNAIQNIYDMLEIGGYVLITTPFLIMIHEEPYDCTRWSEVGIVEFLISNGFEIVQKGSWGNKECLISNLDGWTMYNIKRHSLKNDSRFPLVVWALARKK